MSRFKIGDRAWNIGGCWIELEEVEIASELKESNGVFYYETKGVTVPGISMARESDLFYTEEEALAEINIRIENEVEKISSEVNSVEDLLKMMIDCMYCEEYTNWNKIEVARRKAKELLEVEL